MRSGPEDRLAGLRVQLGRMMRVAAKHPWDGKAEILDRRHCLDTDALTEDRPCRVLLTLDVGYHASGWWRNSDYDRCWHLSVSWPGGEPAPGYPPIRGQAPSDAEVRAWARLAFHQHVRWTWTEPPASVLDPYRLPGIAHVRLFLDRLNHPILPEGEVYNLKPWTEGEPSPEKVFR